MSGLGQNWLKFIEIRPSWGQVWWQSCPSPAIAVCFLQALRFPTPRRHARVVCYPISLGHSLLNRDELLNQSQWYSWWNSDWDCTYCWNWEHKNSREAKKASLQSEKRWIYIGKQRRDKKHGEGRREKAALISGSFSVLDLNHCYAWLFSLMIVFKICIISLRGED